MAVLKKLRSRLFASTDDANASLNGEAKAAVAARPTSVVMNSLAARDAAYDIRPLTVAQLDEVWRLDQRCFVDGEAYNRDTFEYLLTAPESVSYRAVTPEGVMVGFVVGLVEPENTGHVTTVGVAPEHRRRHIAERMMAQVEDGFRKRGCVTVRLEVRSVNAGAQRLYSQIGYVVTQRLSKYYSNGGDGLLMLKSLS